MVDIVALQIAIDTAWSVYRTTHEGVDAADNRRCRLERHLHGRWETREGGVEELASSGLAYLARLPEDQC